MTTIEWLLADSPSSRMQARLGRSYRVFNALLRNPLAVIGALIVLLLIVMAAFAPWFATHSPIAGELSERLAAPSAAHWLGTDELGRDIWSRVVYGSRITLLIVALVAVLAAPAGLLIGAISGYFGGWTDRVMMGITDIFLSMPKLILALAFVAALGPGIENAIIAIAITSWPAYARIARAETLTIRKSDYIAAVKLLVFHDHTRHARHGRHYPHRRRAGLPGPRRAAATPRMGRDDLARPGLHPRSMVGRHHARLCDRDRQSRLLSDW